MYFGIRIYITLYIENEITDYYKVTGYYGLAGSMVSTRYVT